VFCKQAACKGLQTHRTANNCSASCLYYDDVVQAVTFVYLIYLLL